jgi:sugar phosphate isomerase/epimerase
MVSSAQWQFSLARRSEHLHLQPSSTKSAKALTIAGSAKWSHGRQRLDWLHAHDFAIEIAPDPENIEGLARLIWPYIQKGHPIRFHGFLPGYEIGDAQPEAAQRALERHKAMVDAVSEYPEPVITCHIGLTRGRRINAKHAVANLTSLVDYATERGVTITLENLKQGPTATPERHIRWAGLAGAMITLDLGHALSSSEAPGVSIETYIDWVADRLVEVHFYEKETDRHYAPADMRILGPVVERLAQTACRWWTIELENLAEMTATRRMALDFLEQSATTSYQKVVNGLCP